MVQTGQGVMVGIRLLVQWFEAPFQVLLFTLDTFCPKAQSKRYSSFNGSERSCLLWGQSKATHMSSI